MDPAEPGILRHIYGLTVGRVKKMQMGWGNGQSQFFPGPDRDVGGQGGGYNIGCCLQFAVSRIRFLFVVCRKKKVRQLIRQMEVHVVDGAQGFHKLDCGGYLNYSFPMFGNCEMLGADAR